MRSLGAWGCFGPHVVCSPKTFKRAIFILALALTGLYVSIAGRAFSASHPGAELTKNPIYPWQTSTSGGETVLEVGSTSITDSSIITDTTHHQYKFASTSVSTGSNFYWVGAESYDPSVFSNTGIRGTIEVISTPTTGCISFWVADEMASNTVWGQVGYDICNGSTPVAFYQVWSSGAVATTGTTSVSTGSHQFSMYLQSGTTWAYALDAASFGTYNMSSNMSSSSYPVEALSEEGYVSSPYNPPQVQFSTAMQVLKSGSWYSPPSGFEPYGCGSTGMSCWGIQGNLQNSTLPSNSIVVGGTTLLVSAGALLWNSATPDFTMTSSPTSLVIDADATGISTITLTPIDGFTGTVTLVSSVSPSTGLTCTLGSASIAGSGPSTLSCTGSSPGTFTVTVTGTSGSLSHYATVTYDVTDFSVTASPTSTVANVGTATTSTITVAPTNGFTGTVTVSSSISPATGLACTLSPTSLTLGPSQTSTLSCTGTAAGTYTVTVTGTSSSLSHTAMVTVTVNTQDFTVAAIPTSVTANAGAAGSSTINVTAVNSFTGTVTLTSNISPPTGLTCTFSPTNLTLGASGTSTLNCSGSAGTYTVTVTGTSGTISHTVTVTFTIQDFTISASPTIVNTPANQAGTATITVTSVNGFTGRVSLTSSVSPSGLTCTLAPTSVQLGASRTSALSCSSPAAGTFNVTVTATSGSLAHTTTVTYNVGGVPDFTVTASPTSVTILAGATGTSTITITAQNGFTGSVTLSPSISPTIGLTCTLAPTSITLGASGTSALSCTGSAGTYTVTVMGASGSLSHTATVTVTIQDFTISTSPSTISFAAGNSGISNVTLMGLDGFSGIVALASSISPSGLTCILNPTSLTGSGASTLTCSGNTANSFTVTVTGTGGSLSHFATVAVNVSNQQDFTISANPTSLTILAGATASSTITVQPLNGFTGTVGLTSSVSPAGPTCNLSPASVILGVSQTSTLSCSGTKGAYTVTVTGASGSLSHSATVIVTIQGSTPIITTIIKDSSGATAVSVTVGSAVHDTATLSGGSATITGTVTYTLFNNGSCTATGTDVSTVNVGANNEVADSASVTLQSAGPYSFQASYGGDASNYPSTSSCEPLTVLSSTPLFLLTVSTPSAGVWVLIDGANHTSDANGDVKVQLGHGSHSVFVQPKIPMTGPSSHIGLARTFDSWDDGNTDNPRTIAVIADTVLKANYRVTTETSFYALVVGASALSFTITSLVLYHRNKRFQPSKSESSASREMSL